MSVIDFHVHCLPTEVARHTRFYREGWSDLDGLLRRMDEAGIEQSVLLYPTTDAHLQMGGWRAVVDVYNRAMREWARRHSDRLVPAAILSPEPEDLREHLRFIDGEGIRVLSLASSYDGVYLDDERFWTVFETAQTNDYLIHVHPQIINPVGEDRINDPLLSPVLGYMFDVSVCWGKMLMAGVFDAFPRLRFVFAHYGGVLPWLKDRFDSTYRMLRRRHFVKELAHTPSHYLGHVYFDTAGNRSQAVLRTALEGIPVDRILFGSDHPAQQDMIGLIRSFREGGFDTSAVDGILFDNAASLLAEGEK